MNIGEYAKWYRLAEPGEIDDPFGEDVQEVLDSYGLEYVGWAVAKDKYFDDFMDNNIEYCLIAQDIDTNDIGVYEWVGDRLYDPIDEIERMSDNLIFDDIDERFPEDISIHEALQEAFRLNEALKITRSQEYPTKFGTFIIVTKEGKARRMNSMTGKKEWKPVRNSVGYFEDFPEAVEFFLYKDGPNKFVSSSQGNAIDDSWEEFLNARDYDDALKTVEPEVIRCFQDYYQDDSIY